MECIAWSQPYFKGKSREIHVTVGNFTSYTGLAHTDAKLVWCYMNEPYAFPP